MNKKNFTPVIKNVSVKTIKESKNNINDKSIKNSNESIVDLNEYEIIKIK